MRPCLSIILVDSFELPPSYLECYFTGLNEWNREALGDIQVICITQKPHNNELCRLAANSHFPIDIVHCQHDYAGGYPIWDLMGELRRIWPMVRGEYITFNHPEFLWLPGRLRRTVSALRANRQYFSIGNLRRTGSFEFIQRTNNTDHADPEASEAIRLSINECRLDDAKRLIASTPTHHWMFWVRDEDPPGRVTYLEDVFFADKDWLDAWKFIWHGNEMPFQDVYDLIGLALTNEFHRYRIPFECIRLDRSIHEMLHLWHPKRWDYMTPKVRDYFTRDPQRWGGTRLVDAAAWDEMIAAKDNMPKDAAPVTRLRRGPGGTVTRYGASLSKWLADGGADEMKAYLAKHGAVRRDQ